MKPQSLIPRSVLLRSLRLPVTAALGVALLVLPGVPLVHAADSAEASERPPDQAPRQEVVVERRVVVRDAGDRPRERMRERERRLVEMREHAGDLQREGRHEEAERVVREMEEIRARSREAEHPRGRPPGALREGGEVGELQRRLNHLHAALENLRAAEMPELAMEVERRAHEMRRQLEERARHSRRVAERPREELEELRHEVAELRAQLEAMRRNERPRRER